MSMDLTIDSLDDLFDREERRDIFVSAMSRWCGRDLTCDDIPELQSEVERKIMELIYRGNHQSELLVFKLAWIGSAPEDRPMVERQIAHLLRKKDQWEIREAGLRKEWKKGWKKTCKATSNAWDTTCHAVSKAWDATCETAVKTCEAVKDFWDEYKTEIIVGTAVAAVVVAVTIYTAGTGTQAAVAGGAALLDQISQDSQEKKKEPHATPAPSYYPPVASSSSISQYDPIQEITQPLYLKPHLSPLSPEVVYGEGYIADLHKRFGFEYTPQTTPTIPHPVETHRKGQEFVQFIESKLNEARDPSYKDQFSRPAYTQQFVASVESKLNEARDPSYKEPFSRPAYTQQFVASVESALGETRDTEKLKQQLWEVQHDYTSANKAIEAFFQKPVTALPPVANSNNYASTLAQSKPPAPIAEIPLLGHAHQSTIHYHCGINNNFASVVDGGIHFSNILDNQFAVQPHLIHQRGLVEGLGLVGLELQGDTLRGGGLVTPGINWPEVVLDHSIVPRSLDYEVAILSQNAQHIIQTGNPKLKQVHVPFSNGGYVFNEALKRLPQEYKDTIVVITVGSTQVIEEGAACEVFNIIGDKDYASRLCNGILINKEKAEEIPNLEIVPQTGTQGLNGGHYFTQPDYQQKISEILLTDILPKYEID